jgi:hypothetical protein
MRVVEAIDPAQHGVDLFLLERNLALTPAERMQQHEDMLRLMGR